MDTNEVNISKKLLLPAYTMCLAPKQQCCGAFQQQTENTNCVSVIMAFDIVVYITKNMVAESYWYNLKPSFILLSFGMFFFFCFEKSHKMLEFLFSCICARDLAEKKNAQFEKHSECRAEIRYCKRAGHLKQKIKWKKMNMHDAWWWDDLALIWRFWILLHCLIFDGSVKRNRSCIMNRLDPLIMWWNECDIRRIYV